MSREWLCRWIGLVWLEGTERGHVIVGVHVAGERVDGSLYDRGGCCLYFRHWKVLNAEFRC